jgi:hypothetical protein
LSRFVKLLVHTSDASLNTAYVCQCKAVSYQILFGLSGGGCFSLSDADGAAQTHLSGDGVVVWGFGWGQVALAAGRAGLALEAYRAADAALALPADLPAELCSALATHRARTLARSQYSKVI